MKCFNLENGDTEIRNNKIQMTDGNELLRQKIQKAISTNVGECFYNENEGIRLYDILKKGATEEEVKSKILEGLLQVDSSFVMTKFNMELDTRTRNLKVSFTATNADGEAIDVNTSY